MVSKELHRTKCNLMLYSNDDGELKAFRASEDKYPYSTNFSDLPEFIDSIDKDNGSKKQGKQQSV